MVKLTELIKYTYNNKQENKKTEENNASATVNVNKHCKISRLCFLCSLFPL